MSNDGPISCAGEGDRKKKGPVMIRKMFWFALCFVVLSVPAPAGDFEERVAGSRELVEQFMGQLRAELQSAMKAGGPVHAIQVCSKKAPAIAKSLSEKTGWAVGRTSLRVRNAAHIPDSWEREVLNRFEQWKAEGRDVKSLEYHEVIEREGERMFRYMKAIPTGGACLVCHGKTLPNGVQSELDALYPHDQAKGFEVGDLRGAFTIVQDL